MNNMTSKASIMNFNRTLKIFNLRYMSDNKVQQSEQTVAEKVAAMSTQDLVKNVIKVSDWNKRLLVFSGRYKSFKDVPDTLPFEAVDKGRNRVRVKVCNYMIVATVFGFLYTAYSGKKAAEAGDSITKRQLDWHREIEEQGRKEREAAAAAINAA